MAEEFYVTKVHPSNVGDERVVEAGGLITVKDGGKITFESGGELELQAGAVASLVNEALASAEIALADGAILVGDATGKAVAVIPSGDVTISDAGALSIGAQKVTVPMLAPGAALAALLAAGLGASGAYPKTTNGAQSLLAQAAGARVVLLVAVVTEVFANGTGTQPVFALGETTTPNKYDPGTAFTGAALGAVKVFAGTLTATKALLVTGTPATGNGTGALAVIALVLPAAA